MDSNGWRQAGCEGWGYEDVLPYFKRMENYSGGETEYRGEGGPLNIHRPSPQNPIYRAFLDAGEEAGYPRTEDICGFCQEGFGVLDMSVHKGQRSSTATDYLDSAKTRKNLEIITGAQVQRILLDGISATGVRYKKDDGQIVETHARREVLLSAGAVGSPQQVNVLWVNFPTPSVDLFGMIYAGRHHSKVTTFDVNQIWFIRYSLLALLATAAGSFILCLFLHRRRSFRRIRRGHATPKEATDVTHALQNLQRVRLCQTP